jgi:chemotaxis protein MotA
MDIGTILGLIAAFGLTVSAISMGSDLTAFVDIPSVLIVVGGAFSTILIMFPTKVLVSTIKVIGKCFLYKTEDPRAMIEQIVQLADKARKESIVSLEKVQISNKFLARGVMMVADGTELSLLRNVLDIDISIMLQRHWRGQEVLKQLGTYCPAFGMIGTLIGLVQMLQSMDDPSAIGPAMAVALLTTFYGSILANIVWLPMAKKLEERSNDENRIIELMKEGIISIQKGEHPALIREKLQSFLPPSMRETRK